MLSILKQWLNLSDTMIEVESIVVEAHHLMRLGHLGCSHDLMEALVIAAEGVVGDHAFVHSIVAHWRFDIRSRVRRLGSRC